MNQNTRKIHNMKFYTVLAIFAMVMTETALANQGTSVPLTSVKTLVLQEGRMTEGRRNLPIPQLNCKEWNCSNQPSTVKCTNDGWDGKDVTWRCEADLANHLKFGKLDVSCEGYEYPEDPNILAGSCGLSYTLEQQMRVSAPVYSGGGGGGGSGGTDFVGFSCALLAICVFPFIVTSALSDCCGGGARYSSYDYDYYPRRRYSSGSSYLSGVGTGYLASQYCNNRSSGWGDSSMRSGWGSGSSRSSGWATTSRR